MSCCSVALATFWCESSAAASANVDVPPGCGTRQEFDDEVRRRVSDDTILDSTRVVLSEEGGAYVVRVTAGNVERTIRDADCRELFQAAVVVTVAVALSETDTAPRTPPRGTEREQAVEPAPARASRSPALVGALGGGLSAGLLPRATLALELESKLEWSWFAAVASVRYLFPSEELRDSGHGVSVSALGGEIAFLVRPVEFLDARLGVLGYGLFGSGIGSERDQSDAAWMFGPVAGIGVTPLRQAGFRVGVGGEVHVDLVRSDFQILEYGSVFRVPRLGGAAFLRIGHVFF